MEGGFVKFDLQFLMKKRREEAVMDSLHSFPEGRGVDDGQAEWFPLNYSWLSDGVYQYKYL